MINPSLYSSACTEWGTPPEVFDPLAAEFGPFDLDPAASACNAKAPRFYSTADNGLVQEWDGRVWLNPPYGRNIAKWMMKAYRSTREDGKASVVVCLVHARTDTKWFHEWVYGKAEIRFVKGRLRFIAPDGTRGGSSPFPSMVAIYRRLP